MKRKEWCYGLALLLCVGMSMTVNVKAEEIDEEEVVQEVLQAIVEEADGREEQAAYEAEHAAVEEADGREEQAGREAQEELVVSNSQPSVAPVEVQKEKKQRQASPIEKAVNDFIDGVRQEIVGLQKNKESKQRKQHRNKKTGKKVKADNKSTTRLTTDELEALVNELQEKRLQDLIRFLRLATWAKNANIIIERLPEVIDTENVAVGTDALDSITTGEYNIALGYKAGEDLTTGSNNIYIGKEVGGEVDENYTIRLGSDDHTIYIPAILEDFEGEGHMIGITSDGRLVKTNSTFDQ